MMEPQFLYGVFINRCAKTFNSGVSRWTRGHYPVIVQRIPGNPPDCLTCKRRVYAQDIESCPCCVRQVPGSWGAYNCVGMPPYWCWGAWHHHGNMAYAVAPSLDKIKIAAKGPFRFQLGPWSECSSLRSLEASMRYRGYEHFDDSLIIA